MFLVLYGRNCVYILLVTSVNRHLFCFREQGCDLEAWHAFAAVRFRALEDGFCRNLLVGAMTSVVGGLVLDCTEMCWYFDVSHYC